MSGKPIFFFANNCLECQSLFDTMTRFNIRDEFIAANVENQMVQRNAPINIDSVPIIVDPKTGKVYKTDMIPKFIADVSMKKQYNIDPKMQPAKDSKDDPEPLTFSGGGFSWLDADKNELTPLSDTTNRTSAVSALDRDRELVGNNNTQRFATRLQTMPTPALNDQVKIGSGGSPMDDLRMRRERELSGWRGH